MQEPAHMVVVLMRCDDDVEGSSAELGGDGCGDLLEPLLRIAAVSERSAVDQHADLAMPFGKRHQKAVAKLGEPIHADGSRDLFAHEAPRRRCRRLNAMRAGRSSAA